MTFTIVSYSDVKMPALPYRKGYILAIVENEAGRKMVQIDPKHAVSIGMQGTCSQEDSLNGKITMFTPLNSVEKSEPTKVALITGSSKGIGKAIAIALAQSGMNIIINNSRESEEGKAVAAEIQALGRNVLYCPAAVDNVEEVQAMIAKVMEEFGRIDVLVNNAGITRDKMCTNLTKEMWDQVIGVNLTGVFNCTQAVLPHMHTQESGCIINISSIVGEQGNIGQANYSASKGGIISFTKTLARESALQGIRVNAVTPGFIKTDMTDAIPQSIVQDITKGIPLGRFGDAEEIAAVVRFLASKDASYITGQVIGVNGGLRM